MISVSQVESIRQKFNNGENIMQICREENVDYKTAKKYINQEDFSEALPVKNERPKKTDAYAAEIDKLLTENKNLWRKQRLTSVRVYNLLKEEHPDLAASYDSVNRYVKSWRASNKNSPGFSHLIWHAGESQADFGESDIEYFGNITRVKYFVLAFPHSNVSFMQFFRGENCECVCQGLQDIFYYIGGIPNIIVFDNATGIGRRICNVLNENEMFVRFRMHYGFISKFCNPNAGHEKGSVESNVGFVRRNILTPIIKVSEPLYEFNKNQLFKLCDNLMSKRIHYIHNVPVMDLFEDDRKAFIDLPVKKFESRRILTLKTDNYAAVTLENVHRYTLPENYRNKHVLVETGAWKVTVSDMSGKKIEEFDRVYGSDYSESINPAQGLTSLSRKPGMWSNCVFRENLSPDNPFRIYVDSVKEADVRHKIFMQFRSALDNYPFSIVLQAFSKLAEIKNIDMTSKSNIQTMCARLASFPLDLASNPTGVDLNKYQIFMEKNNE